MNTAESYKLLENIFVLKKSTLFSSVNTNELRAVAAIVEELSFRKSSTIVREGDIGDCLYLIKKGKVQITKKVGMHGTAVLAELADGECFGEMAAIDEEVRSASVTAIQDCTLLRISKDDLKDVILECPNIGLELLNIFVKRLRSSNARIETLSKNGEKS
ncbi:MAG: cyclic nucleotide-binding domain-containing protein [Fibrobacter sp.]|nr:cyclic nucleotide-binding domain-containing protein [Fibrobacter sp.]